MSLEIHLDGPEIEVKCVCNCGHKHTRKNKEWFFQQGITHNLVAMAKAVDLYDPLWMAEELGYKKAKELIKPLLKGRDLLLDDPIRFEKFNPETGRGNYNDLLSLVRNYLAACIKHPEADIHVSK